MQLKLHPKPELKKAEPFEMEDICSSESMARTMQVGPHRLVLNQTCDLNRLPHPLDDFAGNRAHAGRCWVLISVAPAAQRACAAP